MRSRSSALIVTGLVLAMWALAGVSTARADIVPAGDEIQVNTHTTDEQLTYPKAVCLGDAGGFIVVFDSPDGAAAGVAGRRFARDGAALGTEFQMNTYTTGLQATPAVACAPDGGAVAVWLGGDGDAAGIFGRRFASDGTPLGPEFLVNTYTANLQRRPDVAVDRNGRFLVVWDDAVRDGHLNGIYAQRYESDGSPAGGQFLVNSYTTGDQQVAAVSARGDSGFAVVWQSFGQDGDGFGVFGQRLATDGARVGTEFRVSSYTSAFQGYADVAATADGGFIVAWQSNQDAGTAGLFAQRYAADGSALGGEFAVNSFTTAAQLGVSLAGLGDGGFVAAWGSEHQDGTTFETFARRWDAMGAPVAPEFRVNTFTTANQVRPAVAADRDGDFVVVWSSYDQDGSGYGVFAQRFADPCGDGTVGAGEACDDGSRVDGPCCSATCQPMGAGTACDPDGVDCTTDTCDGAGACGHTASDAVCPACRRCDVAAGCVTRARTDCRRPARPAGASLQLGNRSANARDSLAFVWQRGATTATGDFGALPASPDYTLCLFDQTGGSDRLLLDATVPAGGGWRKRGRKGFAYRSRAGAPDGVTSAVLQSGANGKAKVTVAGKGAALGFPAFPLTLPVRAQLQAGGNGGVCFAADFAAPKKSTATTFKAKGQ